MLAETCAQRDAFKWNAEQLSVEVVQLREQIDAHAAHAKDLDREHTKVRNEWASKLEGAQREFSEMLSREELESMRFALVEQTEAPWRAKVKALESEVASAREAAAGHRLDAERARSTIEAAVHECVDALRTLARPASAHTGALDAPAARAQPPDARSDRWCARDLAGTARRCASSRRAARARSSSSVPASR